MHWHRVAGWTVEVRAVRQLRKQQTTSGNHTPWLSHHRRTRRTSSRCNHPHKAEGKTAWASMLQHFAPVMGLKQTLEEAGSISAEESHAVASAHVAATAVGTPPSVPVPSPSAKINSYSASVLQMQQLARGVSSPGKELQLCSGIQFPLRPFVGKYLFQLHQPNNPVSWTASLSGNGSAVLSTPPNQLSATWECVSYNCCYFS
jgi:hypothetical protein